MELPSFYSTFLQNILRHIKSVMSAIAPSPLAENGTLKINAGSLLLLSLLVCNSNAAQVYPLNSLKQGIVHFLENEYRQIAHERIDITVGNLDNRLRLGVCKEQPTYTLQDQSGFGGNVSVKAECKSGNKWSVHVPAQVTIYRTIPVANKDIARGEIITQAHISAALVNISAIRQTFLTDNIAAIGQEVKRNIGQGEPFKTSSLDAPTAIKRGETVAVESLVGSIKVSSSGTAMADGRVGQKIRVRNNSSERIVSGVVIGQGLVQTL